MKFEYKLFLLMCVFASAIGLALYVTIYSLTSSTLENVIAQNQQGEAYVPTQLASFAHQNAVSASLIGVLLVIITFLFIILTFRRFIMNPLSSLTKAAKDIASGNLDKRVDMKGADEVGELAVSFNEMADKLRDFYVSLEKKVTEKTVELNQKVRDVASERSRDEAILQGVSDGLIVTDTTGSILLMNVIACEILSLPMDVYKGKRIFEIISLLDTTGKPANPQTWPYIKATLTGLKTSYDYAYILPNGRRIELNITASPFLGGGKIMGSITIIRDVTKERQVDRMKTEFISLASHQLRTPLSAIRWFTEMLLNGDAGKLNPEQDEFAKNISDSTQRMIDLVNSLLNISRIESGRILIDPKLTDLKALVDTVILEVKPRADQKKQHVIVSVHGDLPLINLDPKLIRQVYLNLLTNAIKYTPDSGEISVFISKKDDEIISQVSDNGYGIPKEQHGRIFERFFRAANIIKKETDGTGLGLYLIKAIIESSHGKIWFESEEGKGTSFFFTVPLTGMEAKEGEVTLD